MDMNGSRDSTGHRAPALLTHHWLWIVLFWRCVEWVVAPGLQNLAVKFTRFQQEVTGLLFLWGRRTKYQTIRHLFGKCWASEKMWNKMFEIYPRLVDILSIVSSKFSVTIFTHIFSQFSPLPIPTHCLDHGWLWHLQDSSSPPPNKSMRKQKNLPIPSLRKYTRPLWRSQKRRRPSVSVRTKTFYNCALIR